MSVWKIARRRWDIENTVFNGFKQNWHFEHYYAHGLNGIQAVYALYRIVFNLMLLSAYRNLKDAPRREITLNELARQILLSSETLAQPLPISLYKPDRRPACRDGTWAAG